MTIVAGFIPVKPPPGVGFIIISLNPEAPACMLAMLLYMQSPMAT